MTDIERMTETGISTEQAYDLYEQIQDDVTHSLRVDFSDVLHDDFIYDTAQKITDVVTEEQAVFVTEGYAQEGDDAFISPPAYEQVHRAAECYYGTGPSGALHGLLEEDLLYEWTRRVEEELESAANRVLRTYLRG